MEIKFDKLRPGARENAIQTVLHNTHSGILEYFGIVDSKIEDCTTYNSYSSTGCTYEGNPMGNLDVSTSMTNDVIHIFPKNNGTASTQIDQGLVHLYFDRGADKLGTAEEIKELLKVFPRKIFVCKSWAELPSFLTKDVHSICFHPSELEYSSAEDIVNMVGTMSKLVGIDHPITVTTGVLKNTKYSTVKSLLHTGIFGLVPLIYDYDFDETLKAWNAQWANIPYWPKHIIDQLPGAKKQDTKKSEIKLTPRQEQIFSIVVTKGSSNKSIAKMLNITESTVKLHMGQILKKFGVKNRTQLVAFSKHEV